MFVLEHKVEESKKLNVVNPEVNSQTWYLPLSTKPYLNLFTTIHVERTFKANLANLALKEWLPISPTISWTKFWTEDLEITTYYQNKPRIMQPQEKFLNQYSPKPRWIWSGHQTLITPKPSPILAQFHSHCHIFTSLNHTNLIHIHRTSIMR